MGLRGRAPPDAVRDTVRDRRAHPQRRGSL